MSEEESSSPNFFMIGEKKYQIQDSSLADENGNLVLHFGDKVPIQIKQTPIVDAIHSIRDSNGNRIYSIPKKPPEERFAKVVEAMTDMHKTDGRFAKVYGMTPMEKARTNPQSFAHAHERTEGVKPFGTERNYSKFLTIGEHAGLMSKRKAVVKSPVARTVKARAVEEDKKNFGRIRPYEKKGKEVLPDQYIVRWQNQREKQKGDKYTNRLWKVLKWLNLDTQSLVHPIDEETGEEITDNALRKEWLTKRMESPTFKARDGTMHKFGEIDKAIPDDPKFRGLVFDRTIPTHDYQGKKITTKRSTKFGLDENREYQEGSQGARIPLIATLKGFLDANGWSIGDNVGVNMWALKMPPAKHGQIQMKAQQIIDMFKRLNDGADGKLDNDEYKVKVLKWYEVGGEDKYEEFKTNQADWKDARDYFIIGLQIGWRAEEAFSAVARKLPSLKTEASGVYINDEEDLFVVRIYTRKTAHVGRKFQGGYILREDTGEFARQIIRNRINQVSKGIGIEKKLPNGQPNTDHALIGVDGKYTKIGTLKFPADARMTEAMKDEYRKRGEDIPQVKPVTDARNRLHAILRSCYSYVGLEDSYWHTHAGHSVRHTFAQLWMKKSGQNLAFVKDWGHWGGVDVLEKHYAEPSESEKLQYAKNYGAEDIQKLAQQEAEIAKESDAEKERLAEIARTTYGTDSIIPDAPPESVPDSSDPDETISPDEEGE